VNILGTVNDTYQGALVIKAWLSALGLLQDVMMNVDFPIWYIMDFNKQLANVPSTTQRRVHRLNLIFLFSTAAALVVCFFARALTEYTLCTPHEQIYTVNNAQPRAHCITIRNDRISRIGAYGMSYSRTHHRIIPVEATLKDEVASMSIRIPFSGWSYRFQQPTVSHVEAADIIVPGLTGTYSHRVCTQ